MRRTATGIALWMLWACSAHGGEGPSPADLVLRGNAALASGDYDGALKAYREAAVSLPESPRLKYNQGLAHYRQRDFAAARELFTESLSTRDLKLEAAGHHNLGNCAYSEALEKLKSYDEAIELARESIGCYRRSLELSPNDADARANIETARLLIKDLQDKKKKEEEEKKKQPESQPSSQPQSQPSSQPQSQPSSQPQQQDKGDRDKQQKKDQQQDQQKPQQDQQKQQAGAKQDKTKQKMSREEAQRLLQAVRDKERQRRREQALRGIRVPVDRDW